MIAGANGQTKPRNLPATTTTAAPLPPWMQALRDAVDAEVKDEDMQAIVRAFVDKAKNGDEKAARFVCEYLMGGKFAPSEVTINNHYHGGLQPQRVLEAKPLDNRERIYTYIEGMGPSKAAVIAADLQLPVKTVETLLDHEWFAKCREGFAIARTNGSH